MEWLVCLGVGAVSGFFAGLLGIGGGAIVAPALMLYLPHAGVSGPETVKVAIATSLAIIIPTAIASAQAHAAKGAVDVAALARLAPGVMLGAAAGAQVAGAIDPQAVTLIFILFAVHTSWRMIAGRRRGAAELGMPPGAVRLSLAGAFAGGLAALLGIGGGSLLTPILARHAPMQRAIGTAAVVGLPLAVTAVFGYALAEAPAGCPQGCAGYVFLPAVGAVGVASVLTAPWGAKAAHRLPVGALRRIFGGVLLIVAGNLAYKSAPNDLGAEARRLIAAMSRPAPDAPVAAQAPRWLGANALSSSNP